jgi:uncharacterized membrane protein
MKKYKTNVFKNMWNYIIRTSGLMALGLFATLIVGTIIGQIGTAFNFSPIIEIGSTLQAFMGVGIGVAIAMGEKDKFTPLYIVALGAVGGLASAINFNFDSSNIFTFSILSGSKNPLTVYLVVIGALELTKLILRKKTPIDIILVPLLIVTLGSLLSFALVIPLQYLIIWLSEFVQTATTYQPILMGIVIAVVMGMALTAPISSVAIAVAIKLTGIAAGAACVGCCTQMIGFMIMSIEDNNIGKVISVGIGTSMLQFQNILKKPLIWVPTIVMSAILGPISTSVMGLTCNSVGAGMGTCALIGPIQMVINTPDPLMGWLGAILLCIIIPAISVFGLDFLFRKLKWIKEGDLAI